MARSSSAEKVARLAEKGKGKRIRFQGGTLFPTVVAAVLILGAALITYARQSGGTVITASADATYYASFGVYKCDAYLTGFPEIGSANTDLATLQAGATIAQAGVISWKPQILAGERRAKTRTLFDLYGITVTDDSVTFPKTINNGEKITERDTKCPAADGKLQDAQLEVIVWDDYTSTANKLSIAGLNDVRLTGDGMAIALAFVAKNAQPPQPDSSTDLASLITNP